MNLLQKIFLIIFQTSLNASILILVSMLILKIFNNKLTYRIKYGICFFVILRFIIPVTPNSNIISVTNIVNEISKQNFLSSSVISEHDTSVDIQNTESTGGIEGNASNNTLEGTNSSMEPVEESTGITLNDINNDDNINESYNNTVSLENTESLDEENKNRILIPIVKYASIIWSIGTLILSIVFIFSIYRFSKNAKDSYCLENSKINLIADDLREKLNIKKNIPIYIYDNIKSPCILGLIKPKIYIPSYLENYDIEHDESKTIKYILLHELFHYKRKDTYQNLVALIAVIIHWFNPMAWSTMLKVKDYREYACDSGVLDFLGEDENINYGMTLINFSKMSLNKKSYSNLAICFDFNNQIKGRVKMIKGFKSGSYRVSKKAALICSISAMMILVNGFSVQALNAENFNLENEKTNDILLEAENNNDYSYNMNQRFLVDSNIKLYKSLSELKEKAGFEFNVPNYILPNNKPIGYRLIKASEDNYTANILFESDMIGTSQNFVVRAFKENPIETIKAVEAIEASAQNNSTITASAESRSVVGIYGQDITVTINTPDQIIDGVRVEQTQTLSKSFVWKVDEIYYSVTYYKASSSSSYYQEITNIWPEDAQRVICSFSPVEQIYSVDYNKNLGSNVLSKDYTTMNIYDREDLEKAKTLIGFAPKLLMNINENIKITNSNVGITSDSDIENSDIHYEVNNFYTNKQGSITVNMSNHDTYDSFKNVKDKLYGITNTETNQKISVERIELNEEEVYKYIDRSNSSVVYQYESNGVYYKIIFFGTQSYNDELAKRFIELSNN